MLTKLVSGKVVKPDIFTRSICHPKPVFQRQSLKNVYVTLELALKMNLFTFEEGQLLTAINHHRSLDDRNVRFPMHLYLARS